MDKFLKTALTVVIVLVLVVIAWKLLKFTLAVVLPIAIVAVIGYVIYLLVTGKRA